MFLMNKGKKVPLAIDAGKVFVAKPPENTPKSSWEELTQKALDHPIGTKKLEEFELRDKKVCIITDDWGRPTPASRVVPEIVRRLEKAGVRDENVVFVTASGMHDPMSENDLRRKLGDGIYTRFRCVSHDAGDKKRLAFAGITEFGNPVWVNRYVYEADIKIAVGRVYPHVTYGFEGGYKMIVPGVSSFETILRDHSLNFSAYSIYGNVRENPSRHEADMIGKMVGIDFLIDFVVDAKSEPADCFAGKVEAVFEECVKAGERKVWGTDVGKKYDVTLISSGDAVDRGLDDNPTYYLGLAMGVTKETGTVIALMDEKVPSSRNVIEGIDLSELSLSDLLLLHEKRNWNCSERQLQHYIKSIRGEFYSRRIFEMHQQKLFIVSEAFSRNKLLRYHATHFTDVNEAVRSALASYENPDILVIPEGDKTFPIAEYSE